MKNALKLIKRFIIQHLKLGQRHVYLICSFFFSAFGITFQHWNGYMLYLNQIDDEFYVWLQKSISCTEHSFCKC